MDSCFDVCFEKFDNMIDILTCNHECRSKENAAVGIADINQEDESKFIECIHTQRCRDITDKEEQSECIDKCRL
jgi:hypothetical protein